MSVVWLRWGRYGVWALAWMLAACQSTDSAPAAAPAAEVATPTPTPSAPDPDSLAKAEVAAAVANADRYPDDLARYLAGLPGREGSTLAALESLPSFRAHAKWFDEAWQRKQSKFILPLQNLAAQRFPDLATSSRTAFYPFSGADFLTIQVVYPSAQHYVMFGLEPEGSLPDIRNLPAERLTPALQNLEKSLYELMLISFFKTDDMREEFRATELNGTAPVLLAFLARTGHRILAVHHVTVDSTGKLLRQASAPEAPVAGAKGQARGLQLDVLHEVTQTRKTLTYWSVDVSDGGLAQLKPYQHYLRSLAPTSTYVKSASYLMYKPYFSSIRTLLLDVSDVILQDDSGMPISNFAADRWDLQVFGTYDGPIGMFSNWYQKDLRARYQADSTARPLGFQIGYDRESNLQLARRKRTRAL